MPTVRVTVKGFKCRHCNHTWVPRLKRKPKVCPNCGRIDWDKPGPRHTPPRKPASKRRRS